MGIMYTLSLNSYYYAVLRGPKIKKNIEKSIILVHFDVLH